jgi:hypothetical protein
MSLRILWEDFRLTSDATLQQVYSLPIMARNVTVTVNDYTTADTFEAEIDFKNFPFDPRAIRACGVTIHMQDLGKLYNGDNSLTALQRTKENSIFLGYVDDESISFDDMKRTVKLEGRDLTALLVDRHYTQGPIPLTDNLYNVLRGLLDQLDETRTVADSPNGLSIELRGITLDDLPVLASFYKSDGDHQLNGHRNVDRDENYWEIITDLVARAGLICFIELDKLVITKPRALYSPNQAKVFIYGNNIKNLEMKRKIGRKKTFNVIVRSLVGKDVIEAKIPLEATDEWSKATGISTGEVKLPVIGPQGQQVDPKEWKPAPYMSFRIPDCKDKDHLIAAAQEIYEEVGRQQIEGSFDTRDMVVVQGNKHSSSLFNILNLRNGTPIQVLIDQGDLRGISDIRVVQGGKIDDDATAQKRATYLINRGYESSIAKAFASSLDKFATVFYTKGVRFTLDSEDGFKAHVDFLNFIDTKISGT